MSKPRNNETAKEILDRLMDDAYSSKKIVGRTMICPGGEYFSIQVEYLQLESGYTKRDKANV